MEQKKNKKKQKEMPKGRRPLYVYQFIHVPAFFNFRLTIFEFIFFFSNNLLVAQKRKQKKNKLS